MMNCKDFHFSWERCFFVASLKGEKLILEWIEVENASLDIPPSSHNNISSNESSQEETLFDLNDSNIGSIAAYKKYLTSFKTTLDVQTKCEIIKISFSFDITSLRKVPVIILKCQSNEKSKDNPDNSFTNNLCSVYLIQVRKSSLRMKVVNKDYENCDKLCEFELIKVREYQLLDKNCHINLNTLTVTVNFQILFVSHSCKALQICYHNVLTKNTQNQSLQLELADLNTTHFSLLEYFYNNDNDRSYIFISIVNKENTRNVCVEISDANRSENLGTTSAFELKLISTDFFFKQNLMPITKYMKVLSPRTKNYLTDSKAIHSYVCLLTNTGFLLKIVDGGIKLAINVLDSFQTEGISEDMLEKSSVQLVHLIDWSLHDEIFALQINNFCCLVDFSQEKVMKTWTSVHSVSSWWRQGCSQQLLLIVLHSHNQEPDQNSLFFPPRQSDIVLVSPEEIVQNSFSGHLPQSHLTESLSSFKTVLLGQQKNCESGIRESKTVLQSKIAFLQNSWRHLTETPHNTNSALDGSSLLFLFDNDAGSRSNEDCTVKTSNDSEGILDSNKLSDSCIISAQQRIRQLDHLIVVNLCVKNKSPSKLTKLSLKLVPTLSNQEYCGEMVSHSNVLFNGLNSGQDGFLHPGHSADIGGHMDVTQVLTGPEIRLLIFVCYQPGVTPQPGITPHCVEEYCSEIILSTEDLFCENNNLIKGINSNFGKISFEELQGLNLLQKPYKLRVNSIVSSASCIVQILAQHPLFSHLAWADQYMIMPNHQLKFCRVQILEHTNRYQLYIKIYTRSSYEALLMVKYLSSLLPEDITLVLEKSRDVYLQYLSSQLLQQTLTFIERIRQRLQHPETCSHSYKHSMVAQPLAIKYRNQFWDDQLCPPKMVKKKTSGKKEKIF